MKLTTKRNRWYFWRELFSYMIPMILIVGSVDVFVSFMRCSIHPERSASCSINWILAAMHGVFLVLVIILEIISARKLRKVKKQIEDEFLDVTKETEESIKENIENDEKIMDEVEIKKKSRPKKIIVEGDSTLKNKHKTVKTIKRTTKKSN